MNRSLILLFFILTVFVSSCQSNLSNGSVKLAPKVFKDSIYNTDVQVIDVRKFNEFREGHINKASNINYFSEKFADSINLLDTDKPVFIYCRSGKRSSKSVAAFKSLGFNKIYELEGGILNWKKEGLQIVTK